MAWNRRRAFRLAGVLAAASLAASWLQAQSPAQPAPAQPSAPAQQAPATSAPKTASAQPAAQQAGTAQQPAGQQPAASDADQQPTFTIQRNEVVLIFTVTDKRGHYIPNLQQSDFALLDDGKAPAQVTSFRQQINLPLRVGLLIDASTSIRTRFQFEQQAANEFLLQSIKPASDRAFVMDFAEVPHISQDWTNNLDALETGVDRIKPAGGTALFDSVYVACRDKLLTSRGTEPVRKAMILISDGDDNQSRVHPDEAIKMCQRAETIIYAISTNWTPSRGKGDKVLTEMAEATGGQVFFPPSEESMSESFHAIQQELRSQYALTYVPADFKYDGSFRPIYLYCNDRHYEARAKKGYFAPKQ